MRMTKNRLEEYKSKKDEIRELQQKLDDLGKGDSLIGNDTILDYQTGYPRPQSIVGYDYLKEKHLKSKWQNHLDELTAECMEVESWIENIPDSLIRRIFRMHYMDGKSQEEVAKAVHMSQSNVSRKLKII